MDNNFKNLSINVQKYEYVLGEINAFLQYIGDIPALPSFRNEYLNRQIATGVHSILASEGSMVPIENIMQIQAGISMPAGRKLQEEEVKKMLQTQRELFKEILIENKPAGITPEFIKRQASLLGVSNEPGKMYGKELDEWLVAFCGFLEKEIRVGSASIRINGIIKAIATHAYFELVQPFGVFSNKVSQLVELCILLKSGVPYISAFILPVFYYETRTEYQGHLESFKNNGELSGFMEYALQGLHDGLQNITRTYLAQLFVITWQHHIQMQLSSGETSGAKVTLRLKELILAFPLSQDNGLTFEQVLILNPSIARAYAKRSKTARRDLIALMELGLLVKRKKKYYPNVVTIMGEMALNSSLIKMDILIKKEIQYSHHVMPSVSTVELKSELLKMLGTLEGEQ